MFYYIVIPSKSKGSYPGIPTTTKRNLLFISLLRFLFWVFRTFSGRLLQYKWGKGRVLLKKKFVNQLPLKTHYSNPKLPKIMAEQKVTIWPAVVILTVVFLIGYKACGCGGGGSSSSSSSPDSPKGKIEQQFSKWDGSHIKLERWVKENMNDPDSYEHVKTTYAENGTTISVIMEFRGKNAFGGVVKNSAIAEVDLDGNFVSTPTILK
jgi:hypothetical protein